MRYIEDKILNLLNNINIYFILADNKKGQRVIDSITYSLVLIKLIPPRIRYQEKGEQNG